MKKILIILTLVISVLIFSSNFSSGKMGIGLYGGEPSGIYGRYNVDDYKYLDLTAAWSLRSNTLVLSSNYSILNNLGNSLYYRYGVGAAAGVSNSVHAGIKIPLGLEYDLTNRTNLPINIFAEIAPGISILPGIDFEVSGGIGFVYFF